MIRDPGYSAHIVGTPNIPVDLHTDAGTITLDATRSPHVSGDSITLAMPDASLLDDLDPRLNRRLVIEAGGRSFDLGIREVTPDRAEGTVQVQLASDEALLDDFAQLADDRAPRALETSLRDVVDYVLGKIGAQLEPGTVDADVTAYWPLTNLMTNPSVVNGTDGYSSGTNTSGTNLSTAYAWVGSSSIQWTSVAAGDSFLYCRSFPVEAGKSYVMSTMITTTAGRNVRMLARFRDPDGVIIADDYGPVAVGIGTPNFVRVSHIVTAPEGASNLSFSVVHTATAALQSCFGDGFMFYEGTELVDYFDGSNVPAGYITEWTEGPHRSSSKRIPLLERDPDSTTWRAGDSGLEFLRPLLLSFGYRLVCDEQRRWTIRGETWVEDGDQAFRTGANLITAEEQFSRESDDWFDGAIMIYTWTAAGLEKTRVDAYALPGATKIIRREIRAPYPGPGRAKYAVDRAQGKGRKVTATRQALWTERAEQTFSVTLKGTPIQVGVAATVEFDLGENTVTTTSRTTAIPAAAWVLIPAGETWLDSPVGESWTDEVI